MDMVEDLQKRLASSQANNEFLRQVLKDAVRWVIEDWQAATLNAALDRSNSGLDVLFEDRAATLDKAADTLTAAGGFDGAVKFLRGEAKVNRSKSSMSRLKEESLAKVQED